MKIKIGVAAGVIVAILAWWGIIKYNEYSDKLTVECYKNRSDIERSACSYPIDKRSAFPGTFDALVSAGYFKEIPTCPAGGTYTLYQKDEYRYECTCSIEKHNHIDLSKYSLD